MLPREYALLSFRFLPEQILNPSCQRPHVVVIQPHESKYGGLNVIRLIGHVMSIPLVYGLRSYNRAHFVLRLYYWCFRDFKNLAYLNFILNVTINKIICKFHQLYIRILSWRITGIDLGRG